MDKEQKRLYMQEWRRNNKDRLKLYQERYWRKRIEDEQRAQAYAIHEEALESLREDGHNV